LAVVLVFIISLLIPAGKTPARVCRLPCRIAELKIICVLLQILSSVSKNRNRRIFNHNQFGVIANANSGERFNIVSTLSAEENL
jgi:hypothetical protein